MRIETKQDKEAFRPVTVTMVLETAEELRGLYDLISNHTVNTLTNTSGGQKQCNSDTVCREVAIKFSNNLYNALKDVVKI